MLVSPETLDLAPANEEALALLDGAPGFQRELRASQIEIVTPVCQNAEEIELALTSARRRLLRALDGRIGVIGVGAHPFARDFGSFTDNDRYRMIEDEYRWAARRSVLCGLHVHVAVGGAERTLAVYNAVRSLLPEVVAVAANSPFFEGVDTELCSIRPKLLEALSRTGVPPAFSSWAEFVAFIDWGRRGGLFPDSSFLWWDLRPNVEYGTLELRAADAQTRVEDAAAVAGTRANHHCLAQRSLRPRPATAGACVPPHRRERVAGRSLRRSRRVGGSRDGEARADPRPGRSTPRPAGAVRCPARQQRPTRGRRGAPRRQRGRSPALCRRAGRPDRTGRRGSPTRRRPCPSRLIRSRMFSR